MIIGVVVILAIWTTGHLPIRTVRVLRFAGCVSATLPPFTSTHFPRNRCPLLNDIPVFGDFFASAFQRVSCRALGMWAIHRLCRIAGVRLCTVRHRLASNESSRHNESGRHAARGVQESSWVYAIVLHLNDLLWLKDFRPNDEFCGHASLLRWCGSSPEGLAAIEQRTAMDGDAADLLRHAELAADVVDRGGAHCM